MSFNYRMQNTLCLVYFPKYADDWFGYAKLNVFLSRK